MKAVFQNGDRFVGTRGGIINRIDGNANGVRAVRVRGATIGYGGIQRDPGGGGKSPGVRVIQPPDTQCRWGTVIVGD